MVQLRMHLIQIKINMDDRCQVSHNIHKEIIQLLHHHTCNIISPVVQVIYLFNEMKPIDFIDTVERV